MISTLLASGDILQDLGINPIVLATQVVIFVITFLLLSRILFGRSLANMQQREEEVRKAEEAIKRDRAEVERMTKDYEAHLAKVDKEGYDRTQKILSEALAAGQASVGKAQAEARARSESAIAQIGHEKKGTLETLRSDVTRLTLEVAEKVLDTRLDPNVHGAEVRKFIQERS